MSTELERRLKNLIRIGIVDEVSLTPRPRCRVRVAGVPTGWMQMAMPRAGSTRRWDPLTVGEQVVILSPSGTAEAGVVIPLGLFSDAIAPATNSPDVDETTYPDGAVIRYDHATGALSATGIKTATVQATDQCSIDCPNTHVTGNLTVDGLFTYNGGMQGSGVGQGAAAVIAGDIIIGGISFLGHHHSDPQGGTVGVPQ